MNRLYSILPHISQFNPSDASYVKWNWVDVMLKQREHAIVRRVHVVLTLHQLNE